MPEVTRASAAAPVTARPTRRGARQRVREVLMVVPVLGSARATKARGPARGGPRRGGVGRGGGGGGVGGGGGSAPAGQPPPGGPPPQVQPPQEYAAQPPVEWS